MHTQPALNMRITFQTAVVNVSCDTVYYTAANVSCVFIKLSLPKRKTTPGHNTLHVLYTWYVTHEAAVRYQHEDPMRNIRNIRMIHGTR